MTNREAILTAVNKVLKHHKIIDGVVRADLVEAIATLPAQEVEPIADEEGPLLIKLRELLEIETIDPYTVLTFAIARINRLNAELKAATVAASPSAQGESIGDDAEFKRHIAVACGSRPDDLGANIKRLVAFLDARLARTAATSDPMTWPIPCDVPIGTGTIKKGTMFAVMVARMKILQRMATSAAPEQPPTRYNLVETQYGSGYMRYWDKEMELDPDGEWCKYADVKQQETK